MTLAVVLAFALGQEEEPERLSGADVMPQEILACARLRSASATFERLQGTALADMLAEDEVHAALAELLDRIRQAPAPMEAATGMRRDELVKAFGGELTVAVVGFERNMPRVCIALDAAEGRVELEKLLVVARVLGALVGAEQRIYRGYTIDAVALPQQQKMEICFTFARGLFLLATGQADLQAMIDRAVDGGEALSSKEEFLKAREKLGDPDVFFFAPVRDLLTRFQPMIPEKDFRGIKLLGLDEIRALAASVEVSGKEFVEKVYVLAPEEARLLRLLGREGEGFPAIKYAPFDAFAYGTANLSLQGFFDGIKDLALGTGRGPGFERTAEKLRELLGRSVEEFLDLFSGEFQVCATRPPGAGLVPDVVLLAQVVRPDDVAQSLETLAMALEGRRKPGIVRSSYRGVRFYSVQARNMPISPCFGVVNEFAVLTVGSQAMKRLIASFELPGPALSENPRFREAVEGLPRGRAGFGYADLPEIVNFAYSTLVPFSDNQPRLGDIPMKGLDLPLPEVITPHLTPIVAAVYPRAEGVLVELHSPVPVGVPLAVGAIGAAAEKQKAGRRAVRPPRPPGELEEGEDVF